MNLSIPVYDDEHPPPRSGCRAISREMLESNDIAVTNPNNTREEQYKVEEGVNSMVDAVLMTQEQIEELAEIAQQDNMFWEAFKDRERNQFNPDGTTKIPSIAMFADQLVQRKYGPQHIMDRGSLIIELRRRARIELGLPV
jgi:hypothetical protein